MKTGTTAENYFGLPFIMHESKLPMQHGAQEAVSPPGSVQMHNPGRAHWQSTEKHNILSVFRSDNENFWTVEPFIISYKEFKSLFHTYTYVWKKNLNSL